VVGELLRHGQDRLQIAPPSDDDFPRDYTCSNVIQITMHNRCQCCGRLIASDCMPLSAILLRAIENTDHAFLLLGDHRNILAHVAPLWRQLQIQFLRGGEYDLAGRQLR
jgi:hypothetical protein